MTTACSTRRYRRVTPRGASGGQAESKLRHLRAHGHSARRADRPGARDGVAASPESERFRVTAVGPDPCRCRRRLRRWGTTEPLLPPTIVVPASAMPVLPMPPAPAAPPVPPQGRFVSRAVTYAFIRWSRIPFAPAGGIDVAQGREVVEHRLRRDLGDDVVVVDHPERAPCQGPVVRGGQRAVAGARLAEVSREPRVLEVQPVRGRHRQPLGAVARLRGQAPRLG